MAATNKEPSAHLDFYGARRPAHYAGGSGPDKAESHSHFQALNAFITEYGLRSKKCLEIGSAAGIFQDMVDDYTGADVSEEVRPHYHKPYVVVKDARYPFPDGSFEAIWTIATYEHIPDLDSAMRELARLLKPGGLLFFSPAWQCRPWAAEGYAVRPYADFGLKGKLIKALIPLRDNVAWRSLWIFPKRMIRHLAFILGHKPREIKHRKLKANYETFWTSDSDACNSIDPHDAILWLCCHGFRCLSHPLHLKAFFVRTGELVFQRIP